MPRPDPVIIALQYFIWLAEHDKVAPGLLKRAAQEGRAALAAHEAKMRADDSVGVSQ